MRNKVIFLALCCLQLWVGSSCAQKIKTGRVFLVASYDRQQVCGAPQEQGVFKGLEKEGWLEGGNLQVKRYYMNSKRHNTSAEAMQREGRRALALIGEFKPDVVVTLDDNAFREVGLKLAASGIPVVFSGMNAQPEFYNRNNRFMQTRRHPAGTVTGVYEKLYAVRSLKVISAALPGRVTKVVGITDYTPTGNALSRQLELELRNKPAGIEWQLRRAHDWEDYQRIIQEINRDPSVSVIYPIALSLRASDGIVRSAADIFRWTTGHNRKPEMAVNYYFAKLGLFGGAAVDFEAMGTRAGSYAGQILAGNPAGELPIVDAPDYAIVFNTVRAKTLGINIPLALLTAADHVYR